MKQDFSEQMNLKDLYALRRQLKTKTGKNVKADTPVADIEGIDFDDFDPKTWHTIFREI